MRRALILLFVVSFAASARAEQRGVCSAADADGPRSTEPTRLQRPLDDSDPEMRALMGPGRSGSGCGDPSGCPEVRDRLRNGGDRLAGYLIEQFQRSVEEGCPDQQTYLEYIGSNGSDTAFEFLRARVRQRDTLTLHEAQIAIQAMGYVRDDRSITEALRILEEERDRSLRAAALRAAFRGLQEVGPRQDAVDALLRVAEEDSTVRGSIYANLERLGVSAPE